MAVVSKFDTRKQKEKFLGVYLVEAGLITPAQVDMALDAQKVEGRRLGEILVDRGWIKQQTIEYFMTKIVLPERQAFKKKSDQEKNISQNLALVKQLSQAKPEYSDSPPLLAISSDELEIHLFPRKTVRFLTAVVFGLVLATLFGQFSIYFLPYYPLKIHFANLFNIDGEQAIPTVYSASALLFSSMLLAAIAHAKKVAGNYYVWHWRSLSIIFLYLSLDELIGIHERTVRPLRTALNTSGFLYFAWVIPGAIFVIIFLLAFLRFLFALPAKTRRLFLIAGTLFVAGAIGMELVGGYYSDFYGEQNMTYAIITTIEEFLEMIGIVVFIYALLSYISSYMQGVSLRINIINDKKKHQSVRT